MPQPFGVDTLTSRLDVVAWPGFLAWNGDQGPAFAGRNFIGGSALWAPAEATTALSDPHPDNFELFETLTDLIAPIQGADPTRQQVAGDLGTLYGQIDATAICDRLSAAMATKELTAKDGNLVNVYLQVDPTAPFSADYWAGWSDAVFNATFTQNNADGSSFTNQPYAPCIMCAFTRDGAVLRIDPHVPPAIQGAQAQHHELHARCFGLWADAADLDPALQRQNPAVDFTRFAPTPAPIWLWRFAKTLLNAAGDPIVPHALPIAADAANSVGAPPRAGTDFMLETWKWQPSKAITNQAISSSRSVTALIGGLNPVNTAARARAETCGNFNMPGGRLKVIGRYIRETAALTTFNALEVLAVSATPLRLFTTFERTAGATARDYYNPVHQHGQADGAIAFPYAANILHQPPHTPIFFAIDWSTDDATDAESKTWLTTYLSDIKVAYDAYIAAHPNRPYLIGVYGTGLTMHWLYEQNIVAHFWQAASMCRTESVPPRWPWPHATRWQTFPNPPFDAGVGVPGADLDCDWGDGGAWSLWDGFNQQLMRVELQAILDGLARLRRQIFGNLLDLPGQ